MAHLISDSMGTATKYSYLHTLYKMTEKQVEAIENDTELIHFLREGFKASFAKKFIDFTELSLDIWASILPISKRTLQRVLDNPKHILGINIAEDLAEFISIESDLVGSSRLAFSTILDSFVSSRLELEFSIFSSLIFSSHG